MGLTLGVKEGEYIYIGQDISVQVVKTEGDYMRLDINAPKSVEILRGSLAEETLKAKHEKAPKSKKQHF
jgi:carbon storage regulator